VIEIAAELGIRVIEENIPPADLPRFRQAFLTASTMEIMPVTSIIAQDGSSLFQSDGPGEVIPRLRGAYKEKVAEETAADPA
jgi:branched-subunit amino acid aminotransferase/4-amino-4-deoxychorismate lyase